MLTGGATLITATPGFDENPLLTQHWPRLLRGEFSYTLGAAMGMPAEIGVLGLLVFWEVSVLWLWRQIKLLKEDSNHAD